MRGFPKQSFPTWRGDQPFSDLLPDALEALHRSCPHLEAAIAQLPFAEFEAASINEQAISSYLLVPPRLLAAHAALAADVRAPYLCALLIWNMEHFEPRFRASGLDAEFASHYADAFHRILDQIASDPSFAVIDRDAFLKDLWLTRVVMIPAFAQVWWPRAGLSTAEVLRAGPGTMAHVMLRCGGLGPFLEGHTHDPTAKAYWNPDGWAEAMRLGALALQALPEHRGLFGTAWFYDPALERVTPRLAYTAQMQLSQGAHRFRVGSSASAVQNATATSPSRRELHARGEYLPTHYTVLWARQDLLAAQGAGSAEPKSAA